MACLRGHMTAGPDALAASSSSVPEGVHTASTNAAAAAAAEARFAGMKPSSASVIARSGLGRYDTVLETLTVHSVATLLRSLDSIAIDAALTRSVLRRWPIWAPAPPRPSWSSW